jgi:hypothetical protein
MAVDTMDPDRKTTIFFILGVFLLIFLTGCILQPSGESPQIGANTTVSVDLANLSTSDSPDQWIFDGNGGVYFSENGANISTWPAYARGYGSYEQFINWTWANNNTVMSNFSFVFPGVRPTSGEIALWANVTRNRTIYVPCRGSDRIVVQNVTSQKASTRTDCVIGDTQNTYRRAVNTTNSSNDTLYCFDSFTNVSTTYTLNYSYNTTCPQNQEYTTEDWKAITSQSDYSNLTANGTTYHIYTLNDVQFTPGKQYITRFRYDIPTSVKDGKFDIYAHRKSPQEAIQNRSLIYIALDPWWNASYLTRIPINCSLIDRGSPIVINGSSGFSISGNNQIVWVGCQPDLYLYYNNFSDYVVSNSTAQVPTEVESGNGTSYQATSVWRNDGAVGVYHMNQNGSLVDSAGYLNLTKDGTGNFPQAGKYGNAINFTGGSNTNFYTSAANTYTNYPQGNANSAVMMWLKPDTNANRPLWQFGSASNNWQLGQIYLTKFYDSLGAAANDVAGSAVVQNGSWVHHAALYNNATGNFSIWLNGTYDGGKTFAAQNIGTGLPLEFGISKEVAGTTAFNGLIDEIRVYNASKNSSYLDQLVKNAAGTAGYGSLPPLENYWWNASYTTRYLINCTNMTAQNLTVINGSGGFNLGNGPQIVYTTCAPDTYLYVLNPTTYAVANTAQVAMDVRIGNSTSYNPTTPYTGYKTFWGMDEASGTNVKDSAANTYNGTAQASPAIVAGKVGNARNFINTSSQYVTLPAIQSNVANFSYGFWHMKKGVPTTANGQGTFGTLGWAAKDFNSGWLPTGRYETLMYGWGVTSNSTYNISQNLDKWVYVVVSMTPVEAIHSEYINGTLITTQQHTGTAAVADFNSDMTIAAQYDTNRYLNGTMDELWLRTDRLVTAAEVNQQYNNYIATPGFGTLGAVEGTTSLPYWYPVDLTRNETFFANLSFNTTNNSFYIYENGTTSFSNGTGVMLFYDEFSGAALDTTIWTLETANAPAVSGGISTWTGSNYEGATSKAVTPNTGAAIYSRVMSNKEYHTYIGFMNLTVGGYYTTIGTYGGTKMANWVVIDQARAATFPTDKYYYFKAVKNVNGTVSGYVNSTLDHYNASTTITTTPTYVWIRGYWNGAFYLGSISVDWVGMGKYNENVSVQYGAKETGSWVFSGVRYSERTRVNITGANATEYQVEFNASKFNGRNLLIRPYAAELQPWWNASYTKRALCNTTSGATTTLTNFPAYCIINTSTLISSGKMKSDCSDIVVYDPNAAATRTHEVENCNDINTVVWYLSPSYLGSPSTNQVYLYYGNPTATDTSNKGLLWNTTGAFAVYHGETTLDSTNTYNNTLYAGAATVTVDYNSTGPQKCKFGSCFQYDKDGWLYTNTTAIYPTNTSDSFFSGFMDRATNATVENYEAGLGGYGKDGTAGAERTQWYYGGKQATRINQPDPTAYITVDKNNISGYWASGFVYNSAVSLRQNATVVYSGVGGAWTTPPTAGRIFLGSMMYAGAFRSSENCAGSNGTCVLDEMRFYSQNKSDAWALAEWNSSYSLGAEESQGTTATLTSRIGSITSWGFYSLETGNTTASGNLTNWTMRVYQSASGRKAMNGSVTSWVWVSE